MTNPDILLIDDDRDFLDGREYNVERSSASAIEHFSRDDGTYNGASYKEVWLDFSLHRSDSIMDFIMFAARMANAGTPLDVDVFVIHTSSWDGASLIKMVLEEANYRTVRHDISNPSIPKIIGVRDTTTA